MIRILLKSIFDKYKGVYVSNSIYFAKGQCFQIIITNIVGAENDDKKYRENIKYAEDANTYTHSNEVEPNSAPICLDNFQGRNSGLTSIKRRFQRNRTSFGAEQIAILEKGKLLNL